MRLGEVDRFLVSYRDSAAVSYFLDRLFVAHGLKERLLWNVLRSGGRDSRRPSSSSARGS